MTSCRIKAVVAKLTGLDDFEHFRFEPIGIVDSAGALGMTTLSWIYNRKRT
jgi:hypothetical protein